MTKTVPVYVNNSGNDQKSQVKLEFSDYAKFKIKEMTKPLLEKTNKELLMCK